MPVRMAGDTGNRQRDNERELHQEGEIIEES